MVKKIITAAMVLTAICAGAAAWWITSAVPAQVAAVSRGDLARYVTESGTVESKSAIRVAAKSGGQIEGLYAEEGDKVKKGQLLLKSEMAVAAFDVAGIQAQADGVRAQYETAREMADKNQKLYEEGAVSYDVYLQSKTAADQLEAQLSSLEYSAASASESVADRRVTAPISGIVTQVFVKQGEVLQPGAPILEISGLNDGYIKVNLIAEDAELVKTGMSVTLMNDEDEVLCTGASVRKIAQKAQDIMSDLGITQKRVESDIALPEGFTLRLGTEVEVKILIERRQGVLTVPEKAVFQIEGRDCVYVVQEGKASLRQIESGLKGEDDREVLSGLEEGDMVILSPDTAITEGTRIKE